MQWNITPPWKEWNAGICNTMDEPRDNHIKWSKSDRERQTLYDITSKWNLKNNTNEFIYKTEKKLRDIENKLMVTRGKREVGLN